MFNATVLESFENILAKLLQQPVDLLFVAILVRLRLHQPQGTKQSIS